MAVEVRQFTMDPKLLYDTITRQAGTLDKAYLEGAMNAIEAGANEVTTSFDEATGVLEINDDGKGITTLQEIEDFFQTFGKAHGSHETVIWKQFRMGRGQMFSFGKNTWRTGTFQMVVDIKHKGLDYELHTDLPPVKGCQIKIELYRHPIQVGSYSSVDMMKSQFRKQVRFMSTKITFNGEQLNTPPSECKWTLEDDEAYYLFGAGNDLLVYNLGAYTMTKSAMTAGVTGVIVSKNMLKVNFARNDVQEDCPHWQHIWDVVRENRIKKVRKEYRRLQGHERVSTLQDLRDGEVNYDEVKLLGLIPLCNDKVMSLDAMRKNTQMWTFAPRGDRRADRLMQSESALCLDESVLDSMDYTGDPKQFFPWLLRRAGLSEYEVSRKWTQVARLYRPMPSLSGGMQDYYKFIPQGKLTLAERRVIKILSSLPYWKGRTITIGASDTANAWTDGRTYICLNRDYLKRLSLTDSAGWADLMWVMVHEMSHDDDDTGTHVHATEFYQRFHDISRKMRGQWRDESPFTQIPYLLSKWKSSRIEERTEKAIARQKRGEKKLEKKLGVAAST